jgi:uncharacterized protein YjbJ (UPF0337 family)
MKWNQIQEKWEQWKLAVRAQWGELTGDDLEVIAGRRETLVRKLQQRYGIVAKQARKRIDYWLGTLNGSTQDPPQDPSRHNSAPGA